LLSNSRETVIALKYKATAAKVKPSIDEAINVYLLEIAAE
jgi:hypothetical protein